MAHRTLNVVIRGSFPTRPTQGCGGCPPRFTHLPEECANENGCTDCVCVANCQGASTYCVECRHWTVHPERHEHPPEPRRIDFASGGAHHLPHPPPPRRKAAGGWKASRR